MMYLYAEGDSTQKQTSRLMVTQKKHSHLSLKQRHICCHYYYSNIVLAILAKLKIASALAPLANLPVFKFSKHL